MPTTKLPATKKHQSSRSLVQVLLVGNQKLNSETHSSKEKCYNCGHTFRNPEHLAKHKRGALCRRIVQRNARKQRKMVLASTSTSTIKTQNTPIVNNNNNNRKAKVPPVLQKKKKSIGTGAGPNPVYKPYQCTVCGARFYDKVNVELHLERQHNTNQKLWVEISKMGQDGLVLGHLNPSANISSSSNSYSGIAATSACLDISNNNSRVYATHDGLKCMECFCVFNSETQLNDHRRTVHNNIALNTIDINQQNNISLPTRPQIVDQSTASRHPVLDHHASRNPIYLNTSTAGVVCSDQPQNGNLLSSHKNPLNNGSNQVFPSGYIFPSSSYYNDAQQSSMQNGVVTSTMHQTVHHPHYSQQQANAIIPLQQPHLIDQDLNLLHHHQNSQLHQPIQFAAMSASDHVHHQLAPPNCSNSMVNNPVNQPQNAPDTDNNLLNNSNNISNSCNENGNINTNNVIPQGSTNSTTVSMEIASTSTDKVNTQTNASASTKVTPNLPKQDRASSLIVLWNMCGECGTKFLDLMNLELHVERKHPELKIIGSVDLGDGVLCYKTASPCPKSKWGGNGIARGDQHHICSLCNESSNTLNDIVEHMTAVHFLSGKSLVDAIVSLTELNPSSSYTFGNVAKVEQISPSSSSDAISTILNRRSDDETSSSSSSSSSLNRPTKTLRDQISNSVARRTCEEVVRQPSVNQCHSCKASFNTSAELIRHRIKDKKHTCLVCCYVTCSKAEVLEHIRTEHDSSEFSSCSGKEVPFIHKKLSCFRCGEEFKKTGDFLEHLENHGSLTGKCENCGKQDYNVASILLHMTTLHPDYMNKLAITLMSKGKTWTRTYMQTLSGELVNFSLKDKSSKIYTKISTTVDSSSKLKTKVSKKRPFNLNEKKQMPKEREENLAEHNYVEETSKVYACTECRSIFDDSSLEKHLKRHLERQNVALKRSPSEETVPTEPSSSNRIRVGLESLPNTRGFRCGECGATRTKSELLTNHIKKIHMSGVLIHLIECEKGVVKEFPIHLVTPILT